LGIACALAGVAFLTAPAAAHLVFGSDVGWGIQAIRILSLFLPLAALSDVLVGATRGFGTVVPYVAVESVAKPALRPVLVLLAVAAGISTVLGALVAWAIPIAVGLPVLIVCVFVFLRRSEDGLLTAPRQPRAHRSLAAEFWRFSIPQGLAAILAVAIRWLDIVLVGALRTAREAGVYAAVSRTALFGLFAIDALRIAIAPQISALLAGGNRDRAESVYRVATWWLMLVSWPIYIVLAVWAPVLLRMFGAGFEGGQHALLILSFGMLIATGTGNVDTALLMGGRSDVVLANTAVALGVNVSLNLLLIPAMGIEGAAVAWVASLATENLLSLRAAWRRLRIDPFGTGFTITVVASFCCFGLVGLILRSILGESTGALLIALTLGTGAYFAGVFRWRALLQIETLWRAVVSKLRPSRALPTDPGRPEP
jgi:O-antigen/teichoic acid export membrane protein